MGKSVLISIKPKWCELIAKGEKTVEVRKSCPKLETPFKVYIYCTKGKPLLKTAENSCFIDNSYKEGENLYGLYELSNAKVIGEFVCKNIDWHGLCDLIVKEDAEHALSGTCLTEEEALTYLDYQKGTNIYACKNFDFYGWHISDFKIYDKPKELSEFFYACNKPKGTVCSDCLNRGENKCKSITRPPQSWCYVVEGEESDKM